MSIEKFEKESGKWSFKYDWVLKKLKAEREGNHHRHRSLEV